MKDIATVQDLIDFLEKNFKTDDMLCFFNEGGAWCELEHVPTSFIGDNHWMFNYIKDKKQYELEHLNCREEDKEHMKKVINENYRLVEDGVVIY